MDKLKTGLSTHSVWLGVAMRACLTAGLLALCAIPGRATGHAAVYDLDLSLRYDHAGLILSGAPRTWDVVQLQHPDLPAAVRSERKRGVFRFDFAADGLPPVTHATAHPAYRPRVCTGAWDGELRWWLYDARLHAPDGTVRYMPTLPVPQFTGGAVAYQKANVCR